MSTRVKKPVGMRRIIRDRITKPEYDRVLRDHFVGVIPITVYYTYFDTSRRPEEAELYREKIRVRARFEPGADTYQFQFKATQGGTDSETRQYLSRREYSCLVANQFPSGPVWNIIRTLKARSICAIGGTKTLRHAVLIEDGYCELDATTYPDDVTLYQLEFRGLIDSPDSVRRSLVLSGLHGKAKSKLKLLFQHHAR